MPGLKAVSQSYKPGFWLYELIELLLNGFITLAGIKDLAIVSHWGKFYIELFIFIWFTKVGFLNYEEFLVDLFELELTVRLEKILVFILCVDALGIK